MRLANQSERAADSAAAGGPGSAAAARRRLLLVGAGDMAADLIELVRQHPAYDLVGVLDPAPPPGKECVHGLPVIGWLDDLPAGDLSAVVGLPARPEGFDREAVFQILLRRGVDLPILSSSSADCSPEASLLGCGTVLLRGVRVEAGAMVGTGSLLAPGCLIGRDCDVGEYTVLRPGQKVTAFDEDGAAAGPRSLAAITASERDSIRTVIRRINSSRMEIVMVLGEDGTLQGVITDGDVRRGILAGIDLDGPASGVMNRDPICVPQGTSRAALLALMRKHSIRHVPVVDARRRPVRVEALQALVSANRKAGAVIMAGGLGTRLRPITSKTPKSLVPVAGRPILDHLLNGVRASGIQDVAISVNYLAEAVRAHVGSGLQYGLNVNYLAERDRLGTAGALSLMNPRPTTSFLVLNGDVLTHLNFDRMLRFHAEHDYDIVVCVRKHETRIPYGVVDIRDGQITCLREKPVCTHFINTGIYVLRPACLDLVPNSRFDMTDLVSAVLARGGSVGAFPMIEYWCDIGTPGDLQKASMEQQNLQASVTLDIEDEPPLKETA